MKSFVFTYDMDMQMNPGSGELSFSEDGFIRDGGA